MKKLFHKSVLFFIVSLFTFIQSCKEDVPQQRSENFSNCDRVESGQAVNVMLTAYSTTVFPEDTTSLRVALTDQLARELVTAQDSIRLLVSPGIILMDEKGSKLLLRTDTSGMHYADLYLNGELKACFKAPKMGGSRLKIEALALNIHDQKERIWPGSHEIHVLTSNFVDLKPNVEQLTYRANKKQIQAIGADISFVPQTEAEGRSFKLANEEVEILGLLKETGFNYVRLRLFVNPELEKGYSPEKGYCDLNHTIEFAKRLKEHSFHILLDFHYSDYWADPQKQFKPAAWENLSFNVLADTLENYTYHVLKEFEKQGVLPDMVQIGNEINHGMLWPDGHIGNPDQLATLLKAGIKGVEKVNSEIPIMLHVALGGQNVEAVRWYNNMIARDVKFDVIGLSYYPRWHGTLSDLKYNVYDLIDKFHKPINIVEYNWYKQCVNELAFSLPKEYQSGTFVWEPLHWQSDMADYQGNLNEEVLKIYKVAASNLNH